MKITTLLIWLLLTTGRAATITVFAAASLTDGLKTIARNYQNRTGDKIEFNFAASSVLARQIEEGAPADIFFSADEAKMDALAKKGLIDTATRKNRLSNSLVIIVPTDSAVAIRSSDDLTKKQVLHIALGEPHTVPAGIYAKKYLVKRNLWQPLEPKIVPMENVRAALAAVESGDAQAGIVYKTDAAISKKVRIAVEIPRADTPGIVYPMAMMKETKEPKAARAFFDYLSSIEAGKVFQRFGFIVDSPAP